MTRVDGATPTLPPGKPDPARLTRLTKAVKQLEGVFVQQLFSAMRDTVPENGIASGGAGEDMFTSMFDQKLADQVPQHWHGGLADAMVARLRNRVSPAK